MVLVEFYASWCSHCRRMMPVVENVRRSVAADVAVEQIDVDRFPALAEENGVTSFPTFIVYRNAREVWRQSGEMSETALLAAVEATPLRAAMGGATLRWVGRPPLLLPAWVRG